MGGRDDGRARDGAQLRDAGLEQQAKEMLKAQGVEGKTNVLGAAAIAGFFASAFSLPFDSVKTQLQKMQPLPDGSMPYKGMTDCAMKTVAEHGPLRFYAGFPTYYVRIAPHCMISRRPGLHQDDAGQERVVIGPPSCPTEPQSRAAMNPFAALGLGAARLRGSSVPEGLPIPFFVLLDPQQCQSPERIV